MATIGATLDLSIDGAFVEIVPKDAAECFADVDACAGTGITVAMTVKIVRLVENMVYLSSGGERDDSYGWVIMYKYGQLQVCQSGFCIDYIGIILRQNGLDLTSFFI